MEMDITNLLLTEWNAFLMAAVWIVSAMAERALPHHFRKGGWGDRLEPVFPVAVCTACAVFVPGPWTPEGLTVAQRVILGVVLGAGAYNFAGLAKRIGLTPFVANLTRSRKKFDRDHDPLMDLDVECVDAAVAPPDVVVQEAISEAVHEVVHEAVHEAIEEAVGEPRASLKPSAPESSN